jgi:hypothetical protein
MAVSVLGTKQSQFAKGRLNRQVSEGKGAMSNCPPRKLRRNKTNRPQTGRAGGAPLGSTVRNKANFSHRQGHRRGQPCETNPICFARAGLGWGRARPGREPGWGQACETEPIGPRTAGPSLGRACETNPIRPGQTEMDADRQGREEFPLGLKRAKQSQLAEEFQV